jgi:hypothetical protein
VRTRGVTIDVVVQPGVSSMHAIDGHDDKPKARFLPRAAYDVRMVMSSSNGPPAGLRLPHSTVLLIFGIVVGLGIGFAYGLIKPRART